MIATLILFFDLVNVHCHKELVVINTLVLKTLRWLPLLIKLKIALGGLRHRDLGQLLSTWTPDIWHRRCCNIQLFTEFWHCATIMGDLSYCWHLKTSFKLSSNFIQVFRLVSLGQFRSLYFFYNNLLVTIHHFFSIWVCSISVVDQSFIILISSITTNLTIHFILNHFAEDYLKTRCQTFSDKNVITRGSRKGKSSIYIHDWDHQKSTYVDKM